MRSAAGKEFEDALSTLLGPDYVADSGHDLIRKDKQRLVEIKTGVRGLRDLRAALLQSVVGLTGLPAKTSAILIAVVPGLSVARVREEWANLQHILRPELAGRLSLAVLAANGNASLPEKDAEAARLLRAAMTLRALLSIDEPATAFLWTRQRFAVWHMLFGAWERKLPLNGERLRRMSLVSHPTVLETVRHLRDLGELRFQGREMELAGFPSASLGAILAMGDHLRLTRSFVDASGRPPDPVRLSKKALRLDLLEVWQGGLAGARICAPALVEVNGLPRLDLSIQGVATANRVAAALDVALRPARPGDGPPALVVHRMPRPPQPEMPPTRAAPEVEIVLDLIEMGFPDEARAFAEGMRGKPS